MIERPHADTSPYIVISSSNNIQSFNDLLRTDTRSNRYDIILFGILTLCLTIYRLATGVNGGSTGRRWPKVTHAREHTTGAQWLWHAP